MRMNFVKKVDSERVLLISFLFCPKCTRKKIGAISVAKIRAEAGDIGRPKRENKPNEVR